MGSLVQIETEMHGGEGSIVINNNGAAINGTPGEDLVERGMAEFAAAGRACQFVIGDLINYAAGKWGEKYARWMEVTGLEYNTLARCAAVCRSIPLERRRPSLSFTHHKEVAPLAPDAQERWLNEAETLSMSQKRLARSIQLGRPAMPEDFQASPPASTSNQESTESKPPRGEEPAPVETIHPHVNRLCVILGKMESEGALERMNSDQLLSLHQDILPVLTRHARVLRQILRTASKDAVARVATDLKRTFGPLFATA